jgi:hypothetical protein
VSGRSSKGRIRYLQGERADLGRPRVVRSLDDRLPPVDTSGYER